MSFDDYVNHISQKIRLATAIAVIRSKPKNLNTLEYIEKLRKNIAPMDCDSDITICSDDFDIESDNGSVYVPHTHNIDDASKNFDINAPKDENNDNTKYIDVNMHQNSISSQVIHNNVIEGGIENVIDHNIEPQKTKTSVENDYKGNEDIDFVEILQELKEVRSELDKPRQYRNMENSQSQQVIDDVDSDVTYCETVSNTQITLNKTLEDMQIYSISDFTPFYTHYSESQMQNIAIEPKLIFKNQNNAETSRKEVQFSQNIEFLNDGDINDFNTNVQNATDLELNMTFSQNAQNSESLNDLDRNQYNARADNTLTEFNNISKTDTFATHVNSYVNNLTLENSNTIHKVANLYTHDTNINNETVNENNTMFYNHNDKRSIENKNNDAIANDKTANNGNTNDTDSQNVANESDDMTDSQRETVPFKVIEELNKIKAYLKKRNDRSISVDGSSDSGYRSDSQGRNRKSTYSNTSINQSAHSLLTYIITCSLTTNTYEITKEVSRTLGSLIDKLHEDETYPPFLEIVLETITELLRSIYEDECGNLLLTKDEKIQRVLLLNKSAHIQKYTIDKITNILESIDAEANEINHTAKMENLCYIFHILEIILSKYKVTNNSQSQDSQEKVLKRSSITDIWRKKWNLSKEIPIDNVEKKSDLTKCSEVLNKMIVNCMEGYSLISFVALKCFNLLQP